MHFGLTDDQRAIKDVARRFLADRSPLAKVREAAETERYDAALWREVCELGWPGIAVGERHGGQALGVVELAVVLEEIGYACASTALGSCATVAAIIDAYGSDEDRDRWLPALVSGERSAALGAAELAADAPGSAVAVLIDGGGAVLIADPDAVVCTTIDQTRRFGSVGGHPQPLPAAAADLARVMIAAEIVGVCDRALAMTVEYVANRKQFGVPVGSFQAVAHRCAEMLLHTETLRSAVYHAAWAADASPQALPEAAAVAASLAVDAGREVTAGAIQAHGGIGFTWEADVHWFYKRAQLNAALLGGAAPHRRALTRLLESQLTAGESGDVVLAHSDVAQVWGGPVSPRVRGS
jgi:alkylation response protein AidB-like acyl-CoA dehydrogenase